MPSTHTCLLFHLIFATKNREPLITPKWRDSFHEYLGGVARGLNAHPQGTGGVANHVHMLVGLKATHCLADFMRELKKASGVWAADVSRCPGFHWQEGYAAFTVSASARESVQDYIAKQEEHHRTRSFRDELIEFLTRSGVPYDERYLD